MHERLTALFLSKKTFLKGSGILGFTTILSYLVGIFRDRLLSTTFGASRILDSYNAAFIVPDIILNVFVAGAISAAFVPIFNEIWGKEEDNKVYEFISSVINGCIVLVLIVGGLCFIFAPLVAKIVVPGFGTEEIEIYITLLRILLLSPLIFAISNALGSILVSQERFFWFGISAVLFNLGIILGIIFFAPQYGIFGVALGAIIGAMLHLISRFIGLFRFQMKYGFKIVFSEYYRKFIKLMIPRMAGHPIEQLTFLGFTTIASTLGSGSIAILHFAENFQSMPINVIGVNFALAIFPILSRSASEKRKEDFNHDLSFTIKISFMITALVALIMFLLRNLIVGIILGGGAFDQSAIDTTATLLGIFTISIPTEALYHLFARGFYSLKNSSTPVYVGFSGLVITIALGYFFSQKIGINGIVWGFVIGSYIKAIMMYILLKKEVQTKF